MKVYIGRAVAVATAACSLILAVLPVVGNFDWRSTAGVIAGIAAITTVAQKWLDGLQKHEARQLKPAQAPTYIGGAPTFSNSSGSVDYSVTKTEPEVDPEFTPDPAPPKADPSAAQPALDGGAA